MLTEAAFPGEPRIPSRLQGVRGMYPLVHPLGVI
jgi:hypothetical protein